MSLAKTSNNMKGMAGEYSVCAELCKLNILALLTPKNNPLFDVVASDPAGGKSISIQVKTMGIDNEQGWKLGLSFPAETHLLHWSRRDLQTFLNFQSASC